MNILAALSPSSFKAEAKHIQCHSALGDTNMTSVARIGLLGSKLYSELLTRSRWIYLFRPTFLSICKQWLVTLELMYLSCTLQYSLE